MTILADQQTRELVLTVEPPIVKYTVSYLGPNRYHINGLWEQEFDTPFAALMALRAHVGREARYPTYIDIQWQNFPTGLKVPTTGTTL